MARALADHGIAATFSYAGRTSAPRPQPLPTRLGGFGGVPGLIAYLRDHRITHLVDATHPFAGQISANAVAACAAAGVHLIALERPAWAPQSGDDWHRVPDMAAAAAALPSTPSAVFLAIGRQQLAHFAARPEHRYLVRLVDPVPDMPLPGAVVELATGPFSFDQDKALMQRHGIQIVVAKNAGGSGARAKIDVARALSIPVVMVERPSIPPRMVCGSVAEVMAWLDHDGSQSDPRGV